MDGRMTVVRITHVGAWDRNHGDRAIQLGIRQIYDGLAAERGGEIEWEYRAIPQTRRHDRSVEGEAADDPPTLTPEIIVDLNARTDLLLIGAGGLIMNRTTGPFQVQVDPTDWERLRVPVVFQSIGWNQFPYRDEIDSEWLGRNLFDSLRRRGGPTLFSVRNQGTFERVAPMYPELRLTPDPGFFVEAPRENLPGSGPRIGLCWSSDRVGKRWPTPEAERSYLDGIVDASLRAAEEFDATVWLIPHIAGLDDEIAETLSSRMSARFRNLEEVRPDLYPATFEGADRFVGCYRGMDVVLGMRKHSVILPLGQGVPSFGLGDQAEVRWMLEDLELGENVIPSDADVGSRAFDALTTSLNGSVPDVRSRLRRGRAEFETFATEALRFAGLE